MPFHCFPKKWLVANHKPPLLASGQHHCPFPYSISSVVAAPPMVRPVSQIPNLNFARTEESDQVSSGDTETQVPSDEKKTSWAGGKSSETGSTVWVNAINGKIWLLTCWLDNMLYTNKKSFSCTYIFFTKFIVMEKSFQSEFIVILSEVFQVNNTCQLPSRFCWIHVTSSTEISFWAAIVD